MRVLVISDTHRKLANLGKVLEKVGKIDMLLHCGDVEGEEDSIRRMVSCPVHFVAGNCDYNGENPPDRIVNIEGHTVFMTHGHRYSVGNNTDRLAQMAVYFKAEVAFFGHLHIPCLEERENLIIASPGSLSEPRQENRKPSYIVMDVSRNEKIKIFQYEL